MSHPARDPCLRALVLAPGGIPAMRHGWLGGLPDLSAPYRSAGKISHRAWFSAEEYKRLYTATRERAREPKTKRWKWACEQMHDYVLFMANTGLRPDEARRLEFR